MNEHATAREALLDHDGQQPLPAAVEAHLDTCTECRALADLNAHLAALPQHEAADDLVARTIDCALGPGPSAQSPIGEEALGPGPSAASPIGEGRRGTVAVLAGMLGGVLVGIWALARLAVAPWRSRRTRRWGLAGVAVAVPAAAALGLVTLSARDAEPMAQASGANSVYLETPEEATVTIDGVPAGGRFERTGEGQRGGRGPGGDGDDDEDGRDVLGDAELRRQLAALGPADHWRPDDHRATRTSSNVEGEETADIPALAFAQQGFSDQTIAEPVDPANRDRAEARLALQTMIERAPAGALDRLAQNELTEEDEDSQMAAGLHTVTLVPSVRDLFAERERTDVPTVDAAGYWASTYVPGDPELRLLRGRLASFPDALALAERADPASLALDPPHRGALALSVRADHAAVEGRSRVLLSVGLRGAPEGAGRRPTLYTQVVVDARQPLDADGQARLHALLRALSRARRDGDRTGVLVAGPRGGELLPMGEMRFGELTLALRRLFAERGAQVTGSQVTGEASAMSLVGAVRAAVGSAGRPEGSGSTLGSGVVLVVTPGLTDADARALEPIAHAGALGGVTTTAVGASDTADLAALERVALAGQGRRRVLASPGDADRLVRSEIEAVSRVVARAVRLRIRLAPGVSLVGVLGSRRLDTVETTRVREAEQAVDRELARRLAIESDRGEDEDGIQIVLPAFYAGDEHAILLDLVVSGPGPVADVSARWKDLLLLDNATATERLTLGRGADRATPRERQVISRLLAHELSVALRDAARELGAGRPDAARARIAEARSVLVTARARMPALASDRALSRDIDLCAAYEAALTPEAHLGAMADSLTYASRRRLHGDPLAIDVR